MMVLVGGEIYFVPVNLKLTLMDRKIPRPLSEKSNAPDISIFKNMTFAHNKVMKRMATSLSKSSIRGCKLPLLMTQLQG